MTILPVETFLTTEPVIIVSELILVFTFIIAGKVVILLFITDTTIFPTGTVAHRTCSIALREIVDAVISTLLIVTRQPGQIIRKTKLFVRIAVAAALSVVLADSIARVEVVKTGAVTIPVAVLVILSLALVPTGEISCRALSFAGRLAWYAFIAAGLVIILIVGRPTLSSALEGVLWALSIAHCVLRETLFHPVSGAGVSIPHCLVAQALVSALDVVPVAGPITLCIIIHTVCPTFVSPEGTGSFRQGV